MGSNRGRRTNKYQVTGVEDGVSIRIVNDTLEGQNTRARARREGGNQALTGENDLSPIRRNRHSETDDNKLSRIHLPGRRDRDIDVPTRRKGRGQIGVRNTQVNMRAPGSSGRY